jgi:23S rRNA (uracil1939-C5)-methyltransferase
MEELRKNDRYPARMDGFAAGGAGVCRIAGRAVFVPGALAGELWDVRIVRVTASAVWGRGERLLEQPSPARVRPDCALFPRCGGCDLRHMRYAEELDLKLRRVNDALRRIGGLDFSIGEILPAAGDGLRRRKVIFNIGERDGVPVGGFYRPRSHEIVPLERCPAVPEEAVRCLRAVLDWMAAYDVPAYDEAGGRDGVRHLFYRASGKTGSAVVVPVVSAEPSRRALDALRDLLRTRCPEMTGLVLNRNTARGNTVLAGEFRTLWGDARLTEELCGLSFSLSPRSFFQVNPPQAEKLYRRALAYAAVRPGAPALDLYCGTGTLGLCMAQEGADVVGVEVIPAAVENARENAAGNGLDARCRFLCADAAAAAAELRERRFRPEVVMVDPPRKGLSAEVIAAAVDMAPARIVYVSCDPATLARDLKAFAADGYGPVAGTCVDMFPRTAHVETVVLMSRKATEDRQTC